jgi:hypothetical protein
MQFAFNFIRISKKTFFKVVYSLIIWDKKESFFPYNLGVYCMGGMGG